MENKNLKSALKIGIIGLGLIGGSILKALHKCGYEVVGISKSSYKEAADFCSYSSPDINDIKGCNVVFVCSKMHEILKTLDKLEHIVSPDCIVTDVSSLKRFVNVDSNGNIYKRPYKFIGSHPMAGTEFSGFEHSFAELFEDAKWILNAKCGILEKLILDMGAKPVLMDENAHDKAACLISHLPMLVSCALFNTVLKSDKQALNIASSGFRDTTRLALTNQDLAFDMKNMNFDNLDAAIEEFIKNLCELKNMPKEVFINELNSIQKIRCSMYDENGKNKYQADL